MSQNKIPNQVLRPGQIARIVRRKICEYLPWYKKLVVYPFLMMKDVVRLFKFYLKTRNSKYYMK